jgi:hypothetical protein
MSGLRYLGVGVLVALVLGVFGASAALAVEAPEILPNPTEAAPVKFSAAGPGGKLITAKAEISCTAVKGSGSFNAARSGSVEIKFTGCKSKGVACKTTGAAGEEIIVPGTATLVDLEKSSLLLLGVLITFSEFEITCTGFKIKVKGAVIGEANAEMFAAGTVGLVLLEKFKVTWASTKEVQTIKTCHLTKATCEGKTYLIEANFGTAFEEAGLSQEAEITSSSGVVHIDY